MNCLWRSHSGIAEKAMDPVRSAINLNMYADQSTTIVTLKLLKNVYLLE